MWENLAFWGLAVVGVLLTGVSKSGFAGGAGVVAVPLLALVIPVEQAVALMLPLLLLMDARTVRLYWAEREGALLKRLLPAAVLGIALGGWLLGQVPAAGLQLLLGLLCLLFALWQPLLRRLQGWRRFSALWGLLSGLTSTLIHAGGPPLNAYLMTLQLPKLRWLATSGLCFAVMNVLKIVPYTLAGAWQVDRWWQSLVLVPVAWLGIGVGYRLQQRLSEADFARISRALLLGSGLLLLVKALW